MAVTHDDPTRQVVADTVVDRLDVGTTDATADLVFLTSTDGELARGAMSDPAYGPADTTGVATANAVSNISVSTSGTVAKVEQADKNNAGRIFGTVTAEGGGGDIELTSVDLTAGEEIQIDSLVYTAMQ